jgi:hypothetical protein
VRVSSEYSNRPEPQNKLKVRKKKKKKKKKKIMKFLKNKITIGDTTQLMVNMHRGTAYHKVLTRNCHKVAPIATKNKQNQSYPM